MPGAWLDPLLLVAFQNRTGGVALHLGLRKSRRALKPASNQTGASLRNARRVTDSFDPAPAGGNTPALARAWWRAARRQGGTQADKTGGRSSKDGGPSTSAGSVAVIGRSGAVDSGCRGVQGRAPRTSRQLSRMWPRAALPIGRCPPSRTPSTETFHTDLRKTWKWRLARASHSD
jgi:hypothetical protein